MWHVLMTYLGRTAPGSFHGDLAVHFTASTNTADLSLYITITFCVSKDELTFAKGGKSRVAAKYFFNGFRWDRQEAINDMNYSVFVEVISRNDGHAVSCEHLNMIYGD